MYKVLIVDDEPIAVESIGFMITKNFDCVKEIEKARSGKDAIEKSFQFHPDIIIMDINMPGINGLEAMKQIRKTNESVSFIVISAFDYFDYAVESVALGVEEYLLKPVKEAKFIETFQKVLVHVEENYSNRRQILEQQERLEMIVPILEAGFMNSLCMYGQDTTQLTHYCELFGYQSTSGYVMAIEFGQKTDDHIENKIGAGIHGERMYEEYKNIIKSSLNCIVSQVMLNRIIVYVFDTGEEGDYEQKARAVKAAQRIMERAARIYPDIFIGIGNYHMDINCAKKSYQEALHALRTLAISDSLNDNLQSHILHEDDIIERSEEQVNDYEELIETEIFTKISDSDNVSVQLSFVQLFERMSADPGIDFDAIKKWMISLVVGFEKRFEKVLKNNYYKVLDEIIGAKEVGALYNIGKRYINETVNQIMEGRQNKANSIIEKADKYILEHYNEDISLDEIAQHVNLSSYYFSRFYKNATGTNFTDKMVMLRMDKAKELLKQEELSVKDVSYMVGYSDPNYFSKIFKKVTGFNASEYKRLK
ncbi:MAG: response regulator [Herbinix sp.]|jgi:two-component system response regulator YesN|nr:response regulator [Herbinix sp.]